MSTPTLSRPAAIVLTALLLALAACDGGSGSFGGGDGGGGGAGRGDGTIAPGGGAQCGDVRLTYYDANASGYCEFDRTRSILPAFVRRGMTLAIAQPWSGSSYGGDPGEACGECWELDTPGGTEIVMVHDLCPIEGNPLCAGSHFHFDLSAEAADALDARGGTAGTTRRVACPVEGNVHLQLLDRNQWGYLRFSIVNHRIPVRLVEYRAEGSSEWKRAERSGGAWAIPNEASGNTFAQGGPGGVFRLTSAQGEVRELPNVLAYGVAKGSVFDLGGQLTDRASAAGQVCVFVPPDPYVDGYGGIDKVRWKPNPWSGVSMNETSAGCAAGSCIQVTGLDRWEGFHLYYVQPFARATFARLTLKVKATSGSGTVEIWPNLMAGGECTKTAVSVGSDWSAVTIDLAAKCAGLASLDQLTVQATDGDGMALLLDDVRFE